jgi:hypothetical protein
MDGQTLLRIEVKTSQHLTPPRETKYHLGEHFDHYALIDREGHIRYEPQLDSN